MREYFQQHPSMETATRLVLANAGGTATSLGGVLLANQILPTMRRELMRGLTRVLDRVMPEASGAAAEGQNKRLARIITDDFAYPSIFGVPGNVGARALFRRFNYMSEPTAAQEASRLAFSTTSSYAACLGGVLLVRTLIDEPLENVEGCIADYLRSCGIGEASASGMGEDAYEELPDVAAQISRLLVSGSILSVAGMAGLEGGNKIYDRFFRQRAGGLGGV